MTYGSGNRVMFARSSDGGRAWTAPLPLPATGVLSLGMRRGPRVALAAGSALVSYIAGPQGKGKDGDIWVLRSVDGGTRWSEPRRLNRAPASAREGLHAMAAQGRRAAVVWLDLRDKGAQLYGAFSDDGGATWSDDRLVYSSPSGSVCECCHPSLAYAPDGRLHVMFRNSLEGSRDTYVVASADNGRIFGQARKVGTGSWALKACPMDGGALSVAPDGKAATAWRRGRDVFIADAGLRESRLGRGTQPVQTFTPEGRWVVWSQGPALVVLPPERPLPAVLAPAGAYASLVSADGRPLAAWEEGGAIRIAFADEALK